MNKEINLQFTRLSRELPDEIQINGNNLAPAEAEEQINKEPARKQMQIHV